MVGSGEECQLIRTGHGFDDHDYGVVKYPSPGTAIEKQVLSFEEDFDMERAMESAVCSLRQNRGNLTEVWHRGSCGH